MDSLTPLARTAAGGVDEGTAAQAAALFRYGVSVPIIANQLGITEAEVKAVINSNAEDSCVNGELTFTPAEKGEIKNSAMNLMRGAESEGVRAKVTLALLNHVSVGESLKFKAKHNLGGNQNNAINILIAAREAAVKAANHA